MIPFNHVQLSTASRSNLQSVVRGGGNGTLMLKCEEALQSLLNVRHAFMTNSCTAALELATLVLGIGPGDEVIVPSYTFASSANCIARQGATPVFVDILQGTFCVDLDLVLAAITDKTKAIMVVHYGGQCVDIPYLQSMIAEKIGRPIAIIEDAAQALGAKHENGFFAGTLGDIGCFSFHQTKPVQCGEGGALVTNNSFLATAAVTARDKATNYRAFSEGRTSSYTWTMLGSASMLSEYQAAVLLPQLQPATFFNQLQDRRKVWLAYQKELAPLALVDRPMTHDVASINEHNGHFYWLRVGGSGKRDQFIAEMAKAGVQVTAHYMPLHDSPAGMRYGRSYPDANLPISYRAANNIVRFPTHPGINQAMFRDIVGHTLRLLK